MTQDTQEGHWVPRVCREPGSKPRSLSLPFHVLRLSLAPRMLAPEGLIRAGGTKKLLEMSQIHMWLLQRKCLSVHCYSPVLHLPMLRLMSRVTPPCRRQFSPPLSTYYLPDTVCARHRNWVVIFPPLSPPTWAVFHF